MTFEVRRVDLLLVTAKNATPTIERPASLSIPNASSKIGYYRESAARSRLGTGTIWWGEATDEPARADARPTENANLYHYRRITPLYKFNVAINRNSPQPTSLGS